MAVPPDEIEHVYSIYINAEPDRVWRAITDGDETVQYYYGTRVVSDWQVGSRISYDYPDGTVAADGEVVSIEPPARLEMTFLARWDPEAEAAGPIRHIWELEPADGATKPPSHNQRVGPSADHRNATASAAPASSATSAAATTSRAAPSK